MTERPPDVDAFEAASRLLNEALATSDRIARYEIIRRLQDFVWTTEAVGTSTQDEIFRLLAHDLDFYEPDSRVRREDTSYFGDERLLDELQGAKAALDRKAGMHAGDHEHR